MNIDNRYEIWKNKLLDLGKRNRLINYRDNARSNIMISSPVCGELYDMFVKNEIELVFPFDNEYINNTQTKYLPNVETNKSIGDLQKTLKNLRDKAKTAIEEQGVNVLYLSFGFLKWTESEDLNQILTSPLILVPATLKLESITSPYVLSLHEDEIVLNPTLAYKLENDFGIVLPSFDETADIEAFFEEVRTKISLKNWSVCEDVGLSLLSFLKINMYTDLNKHKDTILSNPIVRAISGDVSAISEIPEDIIDFDFDHQEKPVDVFQVVDADASQQDAILMAKKGMSFVLQGPPGTGKSQTITNIIAESLADGKKILFVSEKMAALDVVHRRLSSVGLDDFCLVLHSHKTNKKSVLEQLGKVLNLSQKKITLSDKAYQKLELLQDNKDKLNEYAEQVYKAIEPLGKSIYEANGVIANLEDYDDFVFLIPDIRNVSKEQFNKYIYLLFRFVSTIGEMTDDYKSNPWSGCHLSSVSNEFRHDVNAYINALLPKIKVFDSKLGEVFSGLHLDTTHTMQNAEKIIEVLNYVVSGYAIPSEWILSDEIQPLFDEVEECMELKKKLDILSEKLLTEYALIKGNDSSINLSDVSLLNCISVLIEEKDNITNHIQSVDIYSLWSKESIDAVTSLLTEAAEIANEINNLKRSLLEIYEPDVFNFDYKALLSRIKTEYTSFTKIFKKEYKQDKKAIQLLHKNIVKKISDEEMLSLVEQLREIDKKKQWFVENTVRLNQLFGNVLMNEDTDYDFYKNQIETFNSMNSSIKIIEEMINVFEKMNGSEQLLQEHYKFLYNGIKSDWEAIDEALNWALYFKEYVSELHLSDTFVKSVCQADEFIETCIESKETLLELQRSVSCEYNWFISNFSDKEIFDNMTLIELHKRLDKCVNNLFLLEEWIDFNAARDNCISGGLEDFIRVIEMNNIAAQDIMPVFKKRFFRLWLDAVLSERPAVLNFRRKMQESTIDEFASLDKIQFEIAKARIRSKLINDLPSFEHFTSGVDEISILRRELNKQRRIMPIRRLFKAIPNLLLTLKPCLMMSPLSVSMFLEAETYKFDIVIFDEASQVCTENAIGAISRAKQVVIAGDSKQLPPTNFFQSATSDVDFDVTDDDDDFDDAYAYESILDEANMLPERTLRWHYRSRHESLIAFSNAKIYKNNLITFPSYVGKIDNNGVEYIYVSDGWYDRGGKKGNVVEAEKVADLVFKHFREQPNRSLGVIAFGEVQQQAIETVIRERRIKNQEFEHFFSEEKEEAFFVKNLENVQGDERDTIIFSIGYAKDASGVFRMNFGPLSKSGGERRLNVAITRAKYNVKLVGSIKPTDINIDKITSEGPKLLRAYIDFAMNGAEVLNIEAAENDITEHDFSFEEAVYNFLDTRGYKLDTQVGCSGYRIDMAVKHPMLSGIYVMGIECDGASYHSARTARERDRLRQDVLESMGWNLYRVWSTDWIKDPVTEGEKLINVIEDAISKYGADENISENEPTNEDTEPDVSDFVSVEERASSVNSMDNLYGFGETESADFFSLPRNQYGLLELTDCIMEIINKEYPIHYDLLCQKLAPFLGNEKVTVKIKRQIAEALSQLDGQFLLKNDFLFPKHYDTVPVRIPNYRKIQHISIEELSEAMLRILKTYIGTTRESLCAETTRVYGFSRTGQNISLAMSLAVDSLLSTDKIEEIDGKLRIK